MKSTSFFLDLEREYQRRIQSEGIFLDHCRIYTVYIQKLVSIIPVVLVIGKVHSNGTGKSYAQSQ